MRVLRFYWDDTKLEKEREEKNYAYFLHLENKRLLEENYKLNLKISKLQDEIDYLKKHQKIEIVQYYEGNKKVIKELLEENNAK